MEGRGVDKLLLVQHPMEDKLAMDQLLHVQNPMED